MNGHVFSQPKKRVKQTTAASPTDINRMKAVLRLVDEEEEMEMFEFQARMEREEKTNGDASESEEVPEYTESAMLEALRALEWFLDSGKTPVEEVCEKVR